MFNRNKKTAPPTNEENRLLDSLLAYEDEISVRLDQEINPSAFLAHSDALHRVRRARHSLELIIFGDPDDQIE